MKITIEEQGNKYEADLARPLDISIPQKRQGGPHAFYLRQPGFQVVEAGSFTGSVARGGSCNCEDIVFNPHGSGTHTECAGHISPQPMYVTDVIRQYFYISLLITVAPAARGDACVIQQEDIQAAMPDNPHKAKAIIIRTLPNEPDKLDQEYSGMAAPYFSTAAIQYICGLGIQHLLTDLPSLDHENDAKLLAHHAFFVVNGEYSTQRSVTEMVYVPDNVADGLYLLNLQIAGFESDAAPSKPVLYSTHLI